MALLHRATITPTKLDAIAGWLPAQPWHQGSDRPTLTNVGAFRFDDPAGEVGVETILVRDGDGPVLQVPMTYRAAPLPGADACGSWCTGCPVPETRARTPSPGRGRGRTSRPCW